MNFENLPFYANKKRTDPEDSQIEATSLVQKLPVNVLKIPAKI